MCAEFVAASTWVSFHVHFPHPLFVSFVDPMHTAPCLVVAFATMASAPSAHKWHPQRGQQNFSWGSHNQKTFEKKNNCMTPTKIIKNTWDTMLQMQYPQTTGLKHKPTINETAERNGARKLLPWQSQNGTCFKSRMMLEHLMISLHALIATIPLVGSGGVLLTLGFWEQTPKPGEPQPRGPCKACFQGAVSTWWTPARG